MWEELIINILVIVGTVAAGISGAFVAIKAKLDLFGVVFVGCVTAVGGGILRDMMVGRTPPAIFSSLYLLLIAAVTSMVVFVVAYIASKRFELIRKKVEQVNNVFDAVGLAAFTVVGVDVAFTTGTVFHNPVLSVLLGLLTGVGGGIFRDILTATTPYIFKKHIYAIACLGGAILYYVLRYFTGNTLIAAIVCMSFVITIRMLATRFRWEVPKVHLVEEEKPLPTVKEPLQDMTEDKKSA